MNTRLRMDFYTLWPELTNNDMRLSGNPTQAYGPHDNSENGGEAGGYNYYLPSGYLKNTQVSENSIFFVQRQKVYWSSMHGDEINLLGTSYDVTSASLTFLPALMSSGSAIRQWKTEA